MQQSLLSQHPAPVLDNKESAREMKAAVDHGRGHEQAARRPGTCSARCVLGRHAVCGKGPGGLPAWTTANQKVYKRSTTGPEANMPEPQYGKRAVGR